MDIDYSNYFWNGELITLRQPKEDDWQEIVPHMFDTRMRFFFTEEVEMPTDLEQYRKNFIERLGKADYTGFAIENNDGQHVGIANLFGIDERNGTFGPVGILINAHSRGRGYASAAYQLLGRYMFRERRMHKWNSGYIEGNTASAALHKKLGFEIEGLQRDMYFHDGRYWNQVICGITCEEFVKRNG